MLQAASNSPLRALSARGLAIVACLLAALSGCTAEPEFRLNSVHRLTVEKEFLDGQRIPEEKIQQLGNVLTAMFGTPNQPGFIPGEEALVNPENLDRAAGAVTFSGKAQGLYREHCAHCHGVTGDGAGPTAAFLNPYPRDFRLGKFKFKSTKMFRPPTDHDLRRVLERGIAGTAMPSFALLTDDELDALVDYVKYLSIRGQVERVLLEELVNLTDEDELISPASPNAEDYDFQLELIMELVDSVTKKWRQAESRVVEVPELPVVFARSRARLSMLGKELFFDKANCVQCHGETGVGDGQTENYDDWTNEWLKRGNVNPDDPDELQVYLDAGALYPRKIRPRNLRFRVYRGGSEPSDLYRRIRAGIEGTSMPAHPNLSDREVWGLVAYLLELPYEELTDEQRGN